MPHLGANKMRAGVVALAISLALVTWIAITPFVPNFWVSLVIVSLVATAVSLMARFFLKRRAD